MKPLAITATGWQKIVPLAVLLLLLSGKSLMAYEYSGITLEMMNSRNTNFYGLGFFTSSKDFTAGVTFSVPTAWFMSAGDEDERDRADDTRLGNRYYPLYSLMFYGHYNFIRTTRSVFFVGFGMMPLIPKKYVYSFSGGVEFFQSESVRFFFKYSQIYANRLTTTNEADEVVTSHLNRIASGPTLTFGVKFAFLGSTRKSSDKGE